MSPFRKMIDIVSLKMTREWKERERATLKLFPRNMNRMEGNHFHDNDVNFVYFVIHLFPLSRIVSSKKEILNENRYR